MKRKNNNELRAEVTMYSTMVLRLRAALEAVEWIDTDYGYRVCPWCENVEGNHKSTCQRQIALFPMLSEM